MPVATRIEPRNNGHLSPDFSDWPDDDVWSAPDIAAQ
jgi:hypothetical protein